MFLLALLACGTADAPRALSIAHGDTGVDVPTGDTGADTAPIDDGASGSVACGGADGWAVVDGALSVDWCARVTPEPGTLPAAAVDTDMPDTGAETRDDPESLPASPPPPCGFVNMVGDLGLGGGVGAPRVLYCDSDPDGGVRFASFDPGTNTLDTQMVASLDCSPLPSSGAMVAQGEGYLAAWSGATGTFADGGSTSDSYGVVLARLGARGELEAGPLKTTLDADVLRVDVALTDPATVLAVDVDGTLWFGRVDAALRVLDATPLATGMIDAGALALGESVVVASCAEEDNAVSLWTIADTGEVSGPVVVDDARCGWLVRPALSPYRDGFLLSWYGSESVGVAAFDAALSEQWRYLPDALGRSPQAAELDDGGVLVFTNDGAVTRLDDTGAVVATAWHPGVVDAAGSVDDLRMQVEGDQALFLAYGMGMYAIGGGHVNTYNFVEISAARIP
jgi:hypothetical protein